MRVVIDTNILISGLISKEGIPGDIINAWFGKKFILVSSEWQISEIRRVSHYPRVRRRIEPHEVGDVISGIRAVGIMVEALPKVDVSTDPDDNFLLASAIAGEADYLISGDKRHILGLKKVEGIPIITARAFFDLLS
jgi:putative PIN family toxin of toxin-antitoxin system